MSIFFALFACVTYTPSSLSADDTDGSWVDTGGTWDTADPYGCTADAAVERPDALVVRCPGAADDVHLQVTYRDLAGQLQTVDADSKRLEVPTHGARSTTWADVRARNGDALWTSSVQILAPEIQGRCVRPGGTGRAVISTERPRDATALVFLMQVGSEHDDRLIAESANASGGYVRVSLVDGSRFYRVDASDGDVVSSVRVPAAGPDRGFSSLQLELDDTELLAIADGVVHERAQGVDVRGLGPWTFDLPHHSALSFVAEPQSGQWLTLGGAKRAQPWQVLPVTWKLTFSETQDKQAGQSVTEVTGEGYDVDQGVLTHGDCME
jgi:hypothetical protein